MPTLDDAVNAIRAGNREEGRQILEEILETDEANEDVWLWLSSVVESDEDREICLENVLALNPDNVVANRGLEALRSGTFNVHEIEEAVEEAAPPPPADATFLDQFTMVSETESGAEGLDLPLPGKKAKPTSSSSKIGGLNKRIIILAAVGLCIVLALAAAAAYNFLGSKGGTPAPQGQPAQNGQPTATFTPTPAPPTATPTPTKTPLQLPTRKPTAAPTPTASPVVSPTAPVGR